MSEPTQPQNDQGPVTLTIPGEKFTEKMRLVLDFAQEEAQGLRHNYIGTEHLLLGLLREGESIAYQVLHSLGIELEPVRRAVTFIVGQGPEAVVGKIGFTPRAVAATTLAFNEAGHLGQEKIAPEHLLLGLTKEGEGIAAGLIRSFGTTLEKVRAQTFQAIAMTSGGKAAEQPSPKSNVVTCRIDARDLDAVDALIEAGIRSTRSDAAAWLIHAGIEANKPLFEKVYGTVAEIRRLRVVAQALAQEAAGSEEGSKEEREEQSS
ncbi:MAG TPA: Clp protease N-terminal domain-containing protein [Ktedonobacteraceae bacterium]|nr:Clp protease N-terminal domain-containing protein [Ktedonobacteraceae bacterium]